MAFLGPLLHHRVRWAVAAWFLLSVLASVASPLVHPQRVELICSSTGMVRLMVPTDDGLVELGATALDCPLCVPFSAPPGAAALKLPPAWPHASPVVVSRTAFPLAATMVLPPATGPPAFFFS